MFYLNFLAGARDAALRGCRCSLLVGPLFGRCLGLVVLGSFLVLVIHF